VRKASVVYTRIDLSVLNYVGYLPLSQWEKIAEKAVILTIWHCKLSAELTKNARTPFWRFLPTGCGFVSKNDKNLSSRSSSHLGKNKLPQDSSINKS